MYAYRSIKMFHIEIKDLREFVRLLCKTKNNDDHSLIGVL